MSWNPVRGCSPVSAGCDNCYAAANARRFEPDLVDARGRFNGTVRCLPERLDQPLHWKKPRRVFVPSMGDPFHENVPSEFIARVWAVMVRCRQHTFQVLTKRPERAARGLGADEFKAEVLHWLMWTKEYYCGQCLAWYKYAGDLDHCVGCGHEYDPSKSDEDDPPCPKCGETDYQPTCPKCGVSSDDGGLGSSDTCETEIEHEWMPDWPIPNVWLGTSIENQAAADERIPHLLKCSAAVRFLSCEPLLEPLDNLPLDGISWVIVGGETGPGARLCEVGWIGSIVVQCRAAKVPVFVKQLGNKSDWGARYKGKRAHPEAWPSPLRVREYPG